MLTSQQCYDVVIVDRIYTILLIRELEIDIDIELLLFAMNIDIEAKKSIRYFVIQEDIEEL